MGYEFTSRDSSYATPHLEFKFSFKLPDPRKERIIVERDEFGRIVHSKAPSMVV